jgi:hypothetical protein
MSEGIVYVLTNPAMPNIVKIGMTTKEKVDDRMNELYTTGVPVPFKCEYACTVGNCSEVEDALHIAFEPYRLNPKREFFKINPEQAVVILKLFAVNHKNIADEVNKSVESGMDPIDVAAGNKLAKSKRAPLNFTELEIPIGAELVFIRNPDIKIYVVSEKKISYDSNNLSLTRLTTQLLEREYNVQPSPYWTYNGRRLIDIYNEYYGNNAEDDE